MKIADLKYGEIVEVLRWLRGLDQVLFQHNTAGVTPATPIEPADHEDSADYGLADGHVLNMEEVDALSEGLRLVIALDAEAQPHVRMSKAFLEYG